MKTCSCGKTFDVLPGNTIKNELGYWFNCDCNSTLFIPSIEVIKKQLAKHPDIAHLSITTWDDVNKMEKEYNVMEKL